MMFVGDKGKILAGFRVEDPQIISGTKPGDLPGAAPARSAAEARKQASASWAAAFKGGEPTFGDFLLAGPISDAFNLGAVSLRLGGKRLVFDAASGKVSNSEEANRCLTRDYRKGWELA